MASDLTQSSRPNTGKVSPQSELMGSRTAWENDAFDCGPDIPEISAGVRDVNYPVAMSTDVYESSQTTSVYPEENQSRGIWFKFKKKLRGFWGTRQTENIQTDKELYIRTTIRELIIYIFFLITLCILTFGMTSSTHYYYTKVMQELFIDSQFSDTDTTFRGITTMQDFWRFAEGPLVDGLFWEKYYNDRNVSEEDLGYIYYENKLLGVARIRQLKVRNGSCEVHPDFQEEITSCYDSYSEANEDTEPFGPEEETAWPKESGNRFQNSCYESKFPIGTSHHQPVGPALIDAQKLLHDAYAEWQYHTEEELDGSSHWGLLDYTYSGGGYYQDLAETRTESLELIQDLKANLWLDRGTRVVFIDFTVYNANINLFCVIRLVVEFPATGGAVPSWQLHTVKLLRYVTFYDYFLLGCECLYLLFIVYYIVEEILEIKKLRCSYFSSVWNCLDILVILLSLVAVAFNVYRTLKVDDLLLDLLQKPSGYPDFEFLGYWQVQYNNMVAVVVFFAWIKIFKYISFNRTMTQLQSTLSRCSKDIAGFAIMFFIIFLAYAQLGYLVFGTQVQDFSTFPESIYTQFRIILGDFDFHALESANRVLGPIFFLTYVFFVFFVLLNMFLAIINDTYSEVKAEISAQKSEFEITDFIKRGYNKVLEKLSLKKDHIKDIQDAIKHADLNRDRQLDWEEWRLDLKMRGIPDAEIEALFAKYDQDGDMVLNDEEQRKLQADLEKQRSNLNDELEEIETKKVSPLERPPSAKSKAPSHYSRDSDDESYEDEMSLHESVLRNYVSKDDLQIVNSRVERMEQSIGSVVSKIEAVIVKLEAMERAKTKRRESVNRLLSSVNENERNGRSSKDLRQSEMEKMLKEELSKFGSAISLRSTNLSRGSTANKEFSLPSGLDDLNRSSSRVSGEIQSRPHSATVNIDEPSLPSAIPDCDEEPQRSKSSDIRSRQSMLSDNESIVRPSSN